MRAHSPQRRLKVRTERGLLECDDVMIAAKRQRIRLDGPSNRRRCQQHQSRSTE